jgi:ubiquinone/menaquinone biosynthesis C-methylase UbiE
VDYDKTEIAKTYDQARSHGPEFLEFWMGEVAAHLEVPTVQTVLDLGCGTGRFSEALATRLNAKVIGADPSIKMLSEGTKNLHPRVSRICGSAEGIPLQTNSVDLVFISMAFHHFTDPSTAAQECRRVLRSNGRVFLRTACRERVDAYAYVPYFPSTRALIEERLPSLDFQCAVFEAASFRILYSSVVTQQIASDYPSYADKLALRADSVLVALDENEFNAGIAAVRSEKKLGPVLEQIDVVVFEKGSC